MLDAFNHAFEKYDAGRFRKKGLNLPAVSEAALLCAAGNLALASGDSDGFRSYFTRALSEIAGDSQRSPAIVMCMDEGVALDVIEFFQMGRAKAW